MFLPTTYLSTILLLILSVICWGSWANTLKITGERWRFELFYIDYSLGVLIASLIAAFTFGTLGPDMTFQDRMLVAGHLKEAYAVAGGIVFNLANMLLVAAIRQAGMAVAFPSAIGSGLVIGVVWNYVWNPQGNSWLLFAGLLLVIAAVIVAGKAHLSRQASRPGTAKKTAGKGLGLSLVSGILMGIFYPVLEKGMGGELGLGPYAAVLLFSIGVFLSTFVFNIFFMNIPVEGEQLRIGKYFHGRPRLHFWGIAGGIMWAAGAIANFAGASASTEVNVEPAISLAAGQCAALVSVLWGLFVWKEFAGASGKLKGLVTGMIALFAGGLVLLSLASFIGKK